MSTATVTVSREDAAALMRRSVEADWPGPRDIDRALANATADLYEALEADDHTAAAPDVTRFARRLGVLLDGLGVAA